MIENLPIKIDSVGRIVIPTKVRELYNIKKDSILYIEEDKNEIILIKDTKDEIIKKLKKLEKHGLSFILKEQNKTLYTSENKSLKEKDHYYCDLKINNYTKYELFIIYNKNSKEFAEITSKLLI